MIADYHAGPAEWTSPSFLDCLQVNCLWLVLESQRTLYLQCSLFDFLHHVKALALSPTPYVEISLAEPGQVPSYLSCCPALWSFGVCIRDVFQELETLRLWGMDISCHPEDMQDLNYFILCTTVFPLFAFLVNRDMILPQCFHLGYPICFLLGSYLQTKCLLPNHDFRMFNTFFHPPSESVQPRKVSFFSYFFIFDGNVNMK